MFSRTERLILANQFKILARLDPDQAVEHERAVEVLEEGYEFEYSTVIGAVNESPLRSEECEDVINVLDMYDNLSLRCCNLSDTSGIDESQLAFPGFDGNSESAHLSYATFLKKDSTRWEQIKIKNSHSPSLDGYRRMLAERDDSGIADELSKDDIQRILGAFVQPANPHEHQTDGRIQSPQGENLEFV